MTNDGGKEGGSEGGHGTLLSRSGDKSLRTLFIWGCLRGEAGPRARVDTAPPVLCLCPLSPLTAGLPTLLFDSTMDGIIN